MKQLKISKLMDEYTDTEFFPTGGSSADPEAVKGWVLANAKPVKQGKQAPSKKKVLAAAALAAVLVVLAGAGFPYIQHNLVGGALTFEQTGDSRIISLVHHSPIMDLEEGRLFFNLDDGQRLDVTGLVSEDTPYLYDGSDPDTGSTYYIIIGGTPDNYGYLEWICTPDPFDYERNEPQPAALLDESGRRMIVNYAFTSVSYDTGERRCASIGGVLEVVQVDPGMDLPWLLAGLDQLGIPYEYPSENLG